jgi:hypothetical protein
LSQKAGFAIYPEGFEIAKYRIGEDHWTEGYFTAWQAAEKRLKN